MAKATIGTIRGSFEYNTECPEEEKKAHMAAFDLTSEEYEARQKESQGWIDEFNKKYPALANLVWANNEMYYMIDGKRVEVKDRLPQIKKEIEQSFKENAPEVCNINIDKSTIAMTKDERVKMLNTQIDKDVKCSLQQ